MDYNIVIQRLNNQYDDAKTIKTLLMNAFNKFLPSGYKNCEDSSSVFTIKKVNKHSKKIIYSFDFAIVAYIDEKINNPDFDEDYDNPDDEFYFIERQQYIAFNKNTQTYHWELRKIASDHRYMEQCVKSDSRIWNELRDLYLEHKNSNSTKKSRIIYYETLNQVYQKHFN